MSLYQVSAGGVVGAGDVNQLVQFVTGLDANDGLSMAMTHATAANRFVGANTQGPPTAGTWLLGDWAMDQGGTQWVCTTAGTPGTWTGDLGVIKETALGAPAATVTFSSIPQNFRHLMLINRAKSSSTATNFNADNLGLQLNGISSSNYNWILNATNQTSTVSGAFAATSPSMALCALWNSFTPHTLGTGGSLLLIPNSTDTNFAKLVFALGYASAGGASAALEIAGGAYASSASTAAVTSVTLLSRAGANFVTNSSFSLYGVP